VLVLNFFGHAAVALWRSHHPGFVLGSMVPDFAAMVRARPPRTEHPELSGGIAFHHTTDEVFHDTPTFRRLSSVAFDDLSARGVGRSAARAVAHVGVEILLDGELAAERTARAAYLDALGAQPGFSHHLEWTSEREGAAFELLVKALLERGLSRAHTSPQTTAYRVTRALAHRPRLALGEGDEARVVAWAEATKSEVARSTPALLEELAAGLGSASATS